VRRIASFTRFLLLLCLAAAVAAARADEARVVGASLRAVEDGLVLDADFQFELSPRLAEAIDNGVPLYFLVEFEIGRHRWYWFDEKSASKQLQLRLSYHALSRQFRLSSGSLQQNFATLDEALGVLKHVRNWLVVDRTVSFSNADYEAAVRLRLDTALLPKPFQLTALTNPDLHLETPWRRFVVHSPKQLPAPVETRRPEVGERQ
jgi:hypothetical protein